MNSDGFGKLMGGLILLGLMSALAVAKGCSDGPKAERVLRTQGYTDIRTTGWTWGCGNDGQCTGFVATSPSGERVSGEVGCGWVLKGCTVRIEAR